MQLSRRFCFLTDRYERNPVSHLNVFHLGGTAYLLDMQMCEFDGCSFHALFMTSSLDAALLCNASLGVTGLIVQECCRTELQMWYESLGFYNHGEAKQVSICSVPGLQSSW